MNLERANKKRLTGVTFEVKDYIESLKKSFGFAESKLQLTEDVDCFSCYWIELALLKNLSLSKCNYLRVVDQVERDVLRRVWFIWKFDKKSKYGYSKYGKLDKGIA
ncbi:hypothetical protein BY458DRAFT_547194 [Sporodiniella umbellata]|nr:hypothetical protein BY458DRAFT_547194 [Sporodiniella umbellata]